jgi:hypothetical protein
MTKHNIVGYMIFVGSIKGDDYFYFLSQLYFNNFELMENSFIVCDNHSIHYKGYYYAYFTRLMNIIYLPRYSPSFNAIELLFCRLKRQLRNQFKDNWFSLVQDVESFMNSVDQESLAKMEQKVLAEMVACLDECFFDSLPITN